MQRCESRDFVSGGIAVRVQDTVARVGTLARESQRAAIAGHAGDGSYQPSMSHIGSPCFDLHQDYAISVMA
jgi:hypothetical protein